MLHLPVLVAAGGINSAGRTSHRHSYRRMVMEALPEPAVQQTRAALSQLMDTEDPTLQDNGTLIRRIEGSHFDPAAIPVARRAVLSAGAVGEIPAHQWVDDVPDTISPSTTDGRKTRVEIPAGTELLVPGTRTFEVSAAGQLPSGFDPGSLYASRSHPRGLQMTVFAASDALADLGIDWEVIADRVSPDAISVYVGSSMGQLDEDGTGGMLRGRAVGRRVTSKQCPLGFAEMPGDFINAYVLRAMANTGPSVGACATFLYNLRQGVADIRAGRARVAVVGAAEAPVVPEIMEGYAAMGALATDRELMALDGRAEGALPDWRRACRPFGENCGFTMAESAQVVVLFDDALALELGAPVLGAVPDVFIHADGAKKSISGPGAGNYLTMARAVATLRAILGDQRLRDGGMVQAHGTGTPQNRVTESRIFSDVARAFGISAWPVGAVKSYIGHSLGAAAGDQLAAMLGTWETGVVAGINTVDHIAEDVHVEGLAFCLDTVERAVRDYAVINSKGFGGNNASAAVLSPQATLELMTSHHGAGAAVAWNSRFEDTLKRRETVEQTRLAGAWSPAYYFNDGVVDPGEVSVSAESVQVGDRQIAINVSLPEDWHLN